MMMSDKKAIDLPGLMALAESWMLPVTPDDLAEGDFTMTENSLVASACNAIPALLELARVQHSVLKDVQALDERERQAKWYGRDLGGWLSDDVDAALAKYNEMMGEKP